VSPGTALSAGLTRASDSSAQAILAGSASALYAAMRDALRRGDWAAFGRAFDGLGRALTPSSRP
jgi:uncharacterized membrane protein (UPF0182 family)